MNDRIDCATHGPDREEAFVCKHLLGLENLGFLFDRDEEVPHPDAWCTSCERFKLDNGGEWTEELTKAIDIQLICGDCYEEIRRKNGDIRQGGSDSVDRASLRG
jgi:hypothetical protein